MVIKIVPAPSNPENPAIFPRAPLIPATSSRAPPIPTRPLAISFHFIDANFLRPSANSLSELTTIFIEIAPNILEKPPNLPIILFTAPISARAPPIPTRPFLIAFHFIEPNFLRPSANFDKD